MKTQILNSPTNDTAKGRRNCTMVERPAEILKGRIAASLQGIRKLAEKAA